MSTTANTIIDPISLDIRTRRSASNDNFAELRMISNELERGGMVKDIAPEFIQNIKAVIRCVDQEITHSDSVDASRQLMIANIRALEMRFRTINVKNMYDSPMPFSEKESALLDRTSRALGSIRSGFQLSQFTDSAVDCLQCTAVSSIEFFRCIAKMTGYGNQNGMEAKVVLAQETIHRKLNSNLIGMGRQINSNEITPTPDPTKLRRGHLKRDERFSNRFRTKPPRVQTKPPEPRKETGNNVKSFNERLWEYHLEGRTQKWMSTKMGFSPQTITKHMQKLVFEHETRAPLYGETQSVQSRATPIPIKIQRRISDVKEEASVPYESKRAKREAKAKASAEITKQILERIAECKNGLQIAEELDLSSGSVAQRTRRLTELGIIKPVSFLELLSIVRERELKTGGQGTIPRISGRGSHWVIIEKQ